MFIISLRPIQSPHERRKRADQGRTEKWNTPRTNWYRLCHTLKGDCQKNAGSNRASGTRIGATRILGGGGTRSRSSLGLNRGPSQRQRQRQRPQILFPSFLRRAQSEKKDGRGLIKRRVGRKNGGLCGSTNAKRRAHYISLFTRY